MEARRDVFQAISDPTRRQIIDLVSKGALNLNAIADQFPVTRQAISLHIRILNECGLIEIRRSGRERFCEARLGAMQEVNDWTAQYRSFWTSKLRSLKHYLEQDVQEPTAQSPSRKKSTPKKTHHGKRPRHR